MKFVLFFLALIVAASCETLSAQHYEFLFGKFKENYNKKYTADEESFRFANFKYNLDFIREHNARTDVSFTTGINHLCDLSRDEYLSLLTPMPLREMNGDVWTRTDIPQDWTVDWRNHGAVTPVKDQGQCGSCWAFSTTGTMEGRTVVNGGSLISLSESEIVDCDTTCYACNGCWPYMALEWVQSNGGDCSESSYSYTPAKGNCKKSNCNAATTCTGYTSVQSGSETALASAVANNGPISVAIDAGHQSFQTYSGGVYNEPRCSSTSLDHAVLCVGYGTVGTTPAWLVKNSWSTSWGVAGYIYMTKDKGNQCGIATSAVFPNSCHNL